jgi:hypothetical protein
MRSRKGMPSKRHIAEYWVERILDKYGDKFSLDWYIEKRYNTKIVDMCFACTFTSKTERAHILPVCEGGNNSVQNIHLLCKSCHVESEYLSGDAYWRWFKNKRKEDNGMYKARIRECAMLVDKYRNGLWQGDPKFFCKLEILMQSKSTQENSYINI